MELECVSQTADGKQSPKSRPRFLSYVCILQQWFFSFPGSLGAVGMAVAATVLLPVAGADSQVGVFRDEQGNE